MKKTSRKSTSLAATPGEASHDSPSDLTLLLRSGDEALAAYDYEEGRALLHRALRLARGRSSAAVPLLALLVDHLAADEEALTLIDELSSDARADDEVRVLLALAAARTGQEDLALTLLEGTAHPRAADALSVLARAAWERQDRERAAALIEQARRSDPSHAEAAALSQALATEQARLRAPLEEEAQLYLELGEHAEAERVAREILARWPESAVARRVLRALEQQQVDKRAAQALALADQEIAAGRLAEAHERLEQALRTTCAGATRAQIEERAAEIARILASEADEARVKESLELLHEQDLTRGLLRYVELPPRLRSDVRSRFGDRDGRARLGCLDDLLQRVREVPEAAELVSAASALVRALSDLGSDAALMDLLPYRDLLSHLPDGRRLLALRERRCAEQKQHHARERIEAAAAALSTGKLDEARALLRSEELRGLPAPLCEKAEALRRRLMDEEERAQLSATYARLRSEGALLKARKVAEQLVSLSDGEERASLLAELEALGPLLRRSFALRKSAGPGPSGELWPLLPEELALREQHPCLLLADEEEGLLLFGHSQDRIVFLWAIAPDSCEVVWRLSLRTPEPLDLSEIVMAGAVLSLAGEGGLLNLRWPELEVLEWRARADLVPKDLVLERCLVAPGGRYLWVETRDRSQNYEIQVLDLKKPEASRRQGPGWRPCVVPGSQPALAVFGMDRGVVLYEPRGAPLRRFHGLPGFIHSLAPCPDGSSFLITVDTETEDDEDGGTGPIGYLVASGDGVSSQPVPIEGSWSDGGHSLCTSLSHGLIFLCFRTDEGEGRILALEQDQGEVRERYLVPALPNLLLVSDAGARRVRAVYRDESGLHAPELGLEAPPLPAEAAEVFSAARALGGSLCEGRRGRRGAEALALVAMLSDLSRPERQRRARALQAGYRESPEELLNLVYALDACGDFEEAREHRRAACALHPDHPLCRVERAREAFEEHRFDEVAALLDRLPEITCVQHAAQVKHTHHMLGRALLEIGQPGRAQAVLAEGAALEGDCDLSGLLALCRPPPEQPVDPLGLLLRVIADGAAHLEQGDAASALRLLDCPLVWRAHEIQSMARLAIAALASPITDEAARFRVLQIVAVYLELHGRKGRGLGADLPLLAGRFSPARLGEVAESCRKWCEEGGSRALH